MSSDLPSHDQIRYAAPQIPLLLALTAYLYLLSSTSTISGWITNAPLLGPLLIGILLGPELAGLLTPTIQSTFIDIGYIGLILIVFEAGLTTDKSLLFSNAALSCMAALTGILLPIASSMALFHGAWGYSALQGFAAGAALCSTSLGTTLALLTPELRRTRVGSVLMAAALLDDVVGLVIAGIIPQLTNTNKGGVTWKTIVRPILASLAFGMGTPLLAWIVSKYVQKMTSFKLPMSRVIRGRNLTTGNFSVMLCDTRTQLFLIVICLSAFVAGSKYAGTSELFGAYLAGGFLAYVFSNIEKDAGHVPITSMFSPTSPSPSPPSRPIHAVSSTPPPELNEDANPTLPAFTIHLEPILTPLLGPIFFASIGAALPIGSLFTTHSTRGQTSHRVVWRGIVYSILMIFGKMAVGVWMTVWPEPKARRPLIENEARNLVGDDGNSVKRNGKCKAENTHDEGRRGESVVDVDDDKLRGLENGTEVRETCDHPSGTQCILDKEPPSSSLGGSSFDETENNGKPELDSISTSEPTRLRSSILLGLAMVARGEIALIVAQLGKPLLIGGAGDSSRSMDEEPYAIVIWAVLLSTFLGALGVGIALGIWERKDKRKREWDDKGDVVSVSAG